MPHTATDYIINMVQTKRFLRGFLAFGIDAKKRGKKKMRSKINKSQITSVEA